MRAALFLQPEVSADFTRNIKIAEKRLEGGRLINYFSNIKSHPVWDGFYLWSA